MSTEFIDFEGSFGSQNPALQPNEAGFVAFSAYFQSHRARSQALLETYRQVSSEAKRTAAPEAAGQTM